MKSSKSSSGINYSRNFFDSVGIQNYLEDIIREEELDDNVAKSTSFIGQDPPKHDVEISHPDPEKMVYDEIKRPSLSMAKHVVEHEKVHIGDDDMLIIQRWVKLHDYETNVSIQLKKLRKVEKSLQNMIIEMMMKHKLEKIKVGKTIISLNSLSRKKKITEKDMMNVIKRTLDAKTSDEIAKQLDAVRKYSTLHRLKAI